MPYLDLMPLILIGAFPVALGLAGVAGLRASALRRQLVRLNRDHTLAVATAEATERQLRLFAGELRETALNLRGHADLLTARDAEPCVHAKTIAGATEHIFVLADELLDRSVQSSEVRGLHEEKLRLLGLVQDAVATTIATLGPSRRHWRIAPELDSVTVTVDRRAMALVLLRVLGNAARFTSHDDWIDIRCTWHHGDVILSIADEGAGHPTGVCPTGLCPPGLCGTMPSISAPNRRGLGLGLTVARQLMRAHDGELTVETAPRVGTRVMLTLPAERVAAMIDLPITRDPR